MTLACIVFKQGPHPRMGVLIRGKKGKNAKKHKVSHVTTETETGMTQSQAEGCQEFPGASRNWMRHKALRGSTALLTSDFRLLSPRPCKDRYLLFQTTQFVAICYSNPRKCMQKGHDLPESSPLFLSWFDSLP